VKLLIGICILVSLIGVGGLLAAELDPALENALANADPGKSFSVIVKLHNPHDIIALDQQLHAQKASKADRHRIVLHMLHLNAEETQGPVLTRLEKMKMRGLVEGYTAHWIENLIVVAGNAEAVQTLATDPAVESIGYNFKAALIDPVARGPIRHHVPFMLDNETVTTGHRATGATRVNHELGITGRGTIIAGLDTGVDGSHPALHNRWRGLTHPHAECWLDLLGTSPNSPQDDGGHGTHTMGTMTGQAVTGNDTLTIGAAPGAEWIACNAINQGVGRALDQDILDAFEWFADPDGDSTTVEDMPDVIQNSWGVFANIGNDPTYTNCFANWNTVIVNCEAVGVVVVFSAGNEGPGAGSMRSPAKFEFSPTQVFSVGAANLSADSIAPYQIADFSSRGPSGCAPNTNAMKPEIVAPGQHVYSSLPNNSYDFMDGTSMAGPHISGIIALMREACPDCDPQTLKEALINTAIDHGTAGDDNTWGHGFVDAFAAVTAVYSLGRVDGHVTTSAGTPVPGVLVEAMTTTNHTTTDTAGFYNLRTTQPGYYTLRFYKFGYETILHDSVLTVEGDTTHLNVTMNSVPTGVLAGRVTLQGGAPVANARVQFPGTPLVPVITDTTGRFVQVLPATGYAVHIEFVLNINPPRGITIDTTVTITAGDTTHVTFPAYVDLVEPSPADAYGYRVYDRYDRDLPCPYDWVNLDPAQNGGGTAFSYPGQDAANFFRAPFPISFYNQLSDTLTVNCNGWMLPGVHNEAGRVATRIPLDSAGDPPGIIAPFWNDVRPVSAARQYVRNDSANGRWIFQFVAQQLSWPTGYVHNWEVHYLDPAYYPTATGDCDILFLYGPMGWLSACTIGIENPLETTGIQVMQDSTVQTWGWPIASGAAMRFTTGRATQVGHAGITLSLYPPPANGTPLAVHIGGRLISSTYGATLGADSVPAAPVSGVLRMAGYEAGRADHAVVPPNGNVNVAMEAWRLDPPRSVSGSQNNGVVVLNWTRPQSVEFHANPALRYAVYRDGVLRNGALADTFFTDQVLPNDSTVHYVVEAVYRYGKAAAAPYAVTIDLAVAQGESVLPTEYKLFPNYPNPFNPETRIRLDIPATAFGRLEVYDLQGRLVKTLYSGTLSAGRYQYAWASDDQSGRHVASGLYFCRFSSAHYTATQKMMLVK
jgi:subtilisin family serine protease